MYLITYDVGDKKNIMRRCDTIGEVRRVIYALTAGDTPVRNVELWEKT